LVDTIQQSSADIHGMDTYSEHVAEPKSDRNAATATGRRSEADVDYVASSQKELERERCWER